MKKKVSQNENKLKKNNLRLSGQRQQTIMSTGDVATPNRELTLHAVEIHRTQGKTSVVSVSNQGLIYDQTYVTHYPSGKYSTFNKAVRLSDQRYHSEPYSNPHSYISITGKLLETFRQKNVLGDADWWTQLGYSPILYDSEIFYSSWPAALLSTKGAPAQSSVTKVVSLEALPLRKFFHLSVPRLCVWGDFTDGAPTNCASLMIKSVKEKILGLI